MTTGNVARSFLPPSLLLLYLVVILALQSINIITNESILIFWGDTETIPATGSGIRSVGEIMSCQPLVSTSIFTQTANISCQLLFFCFTTSSLFFCGQKAKTLSPSSFSLAMGDVFQDQPFQIVGMGSFQPSYSLQKCMAITDTPLSFFQVQRMLELGTIYRVNRGTCIHIYSPL